MIAFAYTECGLSIEQFADLSWYEWSLEIKKFEAKWKRQHEEWEGHAFLTRHMMALMANSVPRKGGKTFTGKDFIKLSFDVDESEIETKVERLTPEQVEKLHPKTLPKLKKLGG